MLLTNSAILLCALVLVFLLGLAIGSFLNVVLFRTATGGSLGGRSHCRTCDASLAWYELVPLVSYLVLGGKCRSCRARISFQYPLVELATGLSYVCAWVEAQGDVLLFVLFALLASVLILIVVYDIRHLRIPRTFSAALIVAAVFLVVHQAYAASAVVPFLTASLAGGVLAPLFFLLLWHVSSGRLIGFGDAQIALPLGALAGAGGVFSMLVLSFWTGAGVVLFLLGAAALLRRGQRRLPFLSAPLTMKSEVPFAPFLIAGFLLVYWFDIHALALLHPLIPF